ncbi:type VII secretion target [Nocardia sp. NBC_00508]|uniref:type VII secretion target n=1 Tax=Nocardia sp. NBC_00508 TaxID=2975992 RepID=UPI002E80E16D|nr:type VII secretion target [Nocardia sp. NBC_00508]WUD68648.1 type VII secretion target [Nocardia sp. NBC_00508]
MNEIVVVSDAIRGYGDASAAMAVDVAAAGAADQAATIAAAIPVFGLIGQDFLAAFAFAQANNMMSVAELAHVHGMTAVAAHESAATYDLTDDASASDFGSISTSI